MSTLKKVLLGVILLTAVAVSGVHFFDLPHIAKAETNAAPPFTVTDMNGQTVSLASLKGKPVFLNFWATWCPPCVGEMPDIQRMYAKYGDKVHFVIVNIDGTKPDVTAFMENHAFSFPVFHWTDRDKRQKENQQAYAVQAIPTSYIIDADSNVVDSHVGALSAGDMESFVTSAF
jgi:cytochrome c-type biogenesis protein